MFVSLEKLVFLPALAAAAAAASGVSRNVSDENSTDFGPCRLDCAIFLRRGARPGTPCPSSTRDCGPCLPGYAEEHRTDGSVGDYCALVGLFSSSSSSSSSSSYSSVAVTNPKNQLVATTATGTKDGGRKTVGGGQQRRSLRDYSPVEVVEWLLWHAFLPAVAVLALASAALCVRRRLLARMRRPGGNLFVYDNAEAGSGSGAGKDDEEGTVRMNGRIAAGARGGAHAEREVLLVPEAWLERERRKEEGRGKEKGQLLTEPLKVPAHQSNAAGAKKF